MISFYPGPSQLYPEVKQYLQDAFESGILSMNHRSPAFVALCERAVRIFKEKQGIPKQYKVFFVSSATEAWEIVGQSFIGLPSFHVYNGAFGEKWMEYRKKLGGDVAGHTFHYNRTLPTMRIRPQAGEGLLCLTHCETSNGTQLSEGVLQRLRARFRKKIIAIDATASMGGVALDWLSGDIWFASVQKCFGLPAGMGIMVCSPTAIEKAVALGENKHYNSLIHLNAQMANWQTTHTPNVLGVYLLYRVMLQAEDIHKINNKLKAREQWLVHRLRKANFTPLVKNSKLRASTVLSVQISEDFLKILKEKAQHEGIVLGNGYGTWKKNTFRIANFPALSQDDFDKLWHFLGNSIQPICSVCYK